jgi:hypothetical protein
VSIKDRLSKLKESSVEVRGETVSVTELTAGQREKLVPMFSESGVSAMRYICAMCARSDGELIWTPEEAENLPPDVVDAIAGEALKLSGMAPDAPNG